MLLDLRHLSKSFDTAEGVVRVLNDVSLTLAAGQSLALTGESGAGKSTLLHLVAGLERADAGQILINGQDLTGLDDAGLAQIRRKSIGLVFQQFNLIPALTIAENLAFQARLAGRHDPSWIAHLSRTLGLEPLLARYPEEISGGQQQRVAVGRALALKPDLILADEPTGNLDEENAQIVLALFLDLLAESGAGLLMVTHSARIAAQLGAQQHLQRGTIAP
ncbi:ABC transporter ATP-binding protein [Rhodobacteraceae bacterium XHP0102]|nr:ABC transporter ATP-binding protein [Rhodobacteraceae bacterium XHP0102]